MTTVIEHIEIELCKYLQSDLFLKELVQESIYPVIIPQGSYLPAIVYRRLATSGFDSFNARHGEKVLIAIEAFAKSYEEVKKISKIIQEIMPKASFINYEIKKEDIYSVENECYGVNMVYECIQRKGIYSYE